MKKLFILAMVAACAVCCKSNQKELAGIWVQPIPGQTGQAAIQGIALNPDGTATSVNMHTLLYTSWEVDGNKLILRGESLGNGQTIPFTDTLTIDQRTSMETLVLHDGDNEIVFSRVEAMPPME